MTRDDIVRMAREARLAEHTHPYKLWSASDDGLERFAKLVAAAEREECAKICGKVADSVSYESSKSAMQCYEAIRERGVQ